MSRCPWPGDDPAMIAYHDEEWGVPVHDDHKWFEFIILDAFQAGLSWKCVLHKRAAFREAFAGFDPERVAAFTPEDCDAFAQNPGIIRNRAKIKAAVTNAQAFLRIREEFGSFDAFIWRFTDNKMRINHWNDLSRIPARTEESDRLSAELTRRGFKFVGSVICYSFMQAAGMVNDHLVDCPRWKEVQEPPR
jgi:DNA-3-methyladenine glycosylase I